MGLSKVDAARNMAAELLNPNWGVVPPENVQRAQAWALVAIAHELGEIRRVLENKR